MKENDFGQNERIDPNTTPSGQKKTQLPKPTRVQIVKKILEREKKEKISGEKKEENETLYFLRQFSFSHLLCTSV